MNRAFAAVTAVILILIHASLAESDEKTFVPANDVSFTISTERSSYRVGEQITLKYRITNISNAPLYAPQKWEVTCPGGPHVWAWFENSSGHHFVGGYSGSCSNNPKTVSERMGKEAVLLKPGEHIDDTFQLDTTLFGGLKPGEYRIEATLNGWTEEKFTDAERSELERMGNPFLRGEAPASMRVTLTP
jgi:hypothetical protein